MERRNGSPLVAVLYGPTASGKTDLSIDLCLRLRDEVGVEPVVVSADSRQVYKYMDIGTAKVTVPEMRGIRHEMLDVADPVHKLELESYVRMARPHLDAGDGLRLPLIVGGTGVYVTALLEDWNLGGTAALRASLQRDFPARRVADAYVVLQRADAKAAARVHPNNYEGIINALVRRMSMGADRLGSAGAREDRRVVLLGLDPGARAVEEGIVRRLDVQFRKGLVDEVLFLADRYRLDDVMRRGAPSDNQVMHTHGYREFFERARELRLPVRGLSAADHRLVRDRIAEHVQAYSRRQRAWFRKLRGVRMIRTSDDAYRAVVSALRSEAGTPHRGA
jgi:tRNA dimethylallyltransferase